MGNGRRKGAGTGCGGSVQSGFQLVSKKNYMPIRGEPLTVKFF